MYAAASSRVEAVLLLLTLHFMLTSAPAVSNNMTASTLLLRAALIKAV